MEQHRRQLKRKRLWSAEEDGKLRNYVDMHGDQYWDTVASNLGRKGNSCRLRWVNYLNPDIVRVKWNNTDEEMLFILRLYSELGFNKWSKIAKRLPGRTDNDIKNYWNTRVKKEAKRLNCDVKSDNFPSIMMARLMERIQAASGVGPPTTSTTAVDHAYLIAALPPLAVADGSDGCKTGTILVPSSSTDPSTVGNPNIGAAISSDDFMSALELGNLDADNPYLIDGLPSLAVEGGSGGGTSTTLVATPSTLAPTSGHPNIGATICSETAHDQLGSLGSNRSTLDADHAYLIPALPPLAVAGGGGGGTTASLVASFSSSNVPIVGHSIIGAADCYDDVWGNLPPITILDDPPS